MSLQIKNVPLKILANCNSFVLANNLLSKLKCKSSWEFTQIFNIIGYTSVNYYSSKSSLSPPSPPPPQKPTNCKTLKEICGDKVKNESDCTPGYCPKNQRTSCYPIRPKCGDVKKTKVEDTIVEALPPIIDKIDYTKVTCPVSKFEKPSACPISPASKNVLDDIILTNVTAPPLFPELPKPPCGPVVLCHCPPPPKLHPGECPCASATPDTQSANPVQPCVRKFKYSCPEKRIFHCPPRLIVIDHSNINQNRNIKSQ